MSQYKSILKIIFVLFIYFSSALHAQTNFWSFSNGPFAGSAQFLAANSKGDVFAGDGSHLYRSIDRGSTWVNIYNVTYPDIFNGLIVNSQDDIFVAGGKGSIYHSIDNGNTWSKVQTPGNNLVSAIFFDNNQLYAAVDNAIYTSTNLGNTWSSWKASPNDLITSFATYPFKAEVGASHLISTPSLTAPFLSDIVSSNGDSLTAATNLVLRLIASQGSENLYAASDTAVYRYDVIKKQWNRLSISASGIGIKNIQTSLLGDLFISYFPLNTNGITYTVRSRDNGKTFTAFGPPGVSVITVIEAGNLFYCGTFNGGVYQSADDGVSWHSGIFGFPFECYSVVKGSSNKILTCGRSGAFASDDNGAHWKPMSGLPAGTIYYFRYSATGSLYAQQIGTPDFHVSLDSGETWMPDKDSVSSVDQLGGIYKDDVYGSGAFERSTNDGKSWTSFKLVYGGKKLYSHFVSREGHVFAPTPKSDTILRSTDLGASWVNVRPSSSLIGADTIALALLAEGSNGTLFITKSIYHKSGSGNTTIFRSTDDGTTWEASSGLSITSGINYIVFGGNAVYALTSASDSSVFRSTDDGLTWQLLSSGLSGSVNNIFQNSDGTLFAATKSSVFRHPGLANGVSISRTMISDVNLRINPNPAGNDAMFTFELPHSGIVSLEVIDLLGHVVCKIFTGELSEGVQTINWHNAGLLSGFYICRLHAGGAQGNEGFMIRN